MKKIVVTIESNDNDVSNAVTLLLRTNSFDCNYEFEINPEYPFQYKKPFNKPYFVDSPIYCMTFYYHFAQDINQQNQQALFQELEAFAQAYTHHIKKVMMNSGQFTERLAATQNSSLMQIARMGADLQMVDVRKQLTITAYTPQLFSSPFPQNTPLSKKNNSNIPYYLCEIGLIIALSAITAPTGLAIALGCVAALLFIAGGLLLVKNRAGNVENEFGLNLSPAIT